MYVSMMCCVVLQHRTNASFRFGKATRLIHHHSFINIMIMMIMIMITIITIITMIMMIIIDEMDDFRSNADLYQIKSPSLFHTAIQHR